MSPFQRHIQACNNLPSFSGLVPLRIGQARAGWMRPAVAAQLEGVPGIAVGPDGVVLEVGSPEAASLVLDAAARQLADRGRCRLRGEAFDVRETPTGKVLGQVDRGALPALGVISQGAHLNGRVMRPDGLHLWVGWRAKDKAVAPGQLDNLVAGGVPAGLDPAATLRKEAEEEASLPAELARKAQAVGRVSYVMAQEDGGIRRDVLHVYDLEVPEDVIPHPGDDEVERFELWHVRRVLEAVRDTESVKFNVNLVLIHLFLREGLIPREEATTLREGLERPLSPGAR